MFRRLPLAWAKKVLPAAAAAPAKFAPVNAVSLVGVMHDVTTGFIGEEPVTQFTLTTTHIATDADAPDLHAPKTVGSAREQQRDHYVIRAMGETAASVAAVAAEGNVATVSGQLRMNARNDGGKPFFYPFVAVTAKANGVVQVLHEKKKRTSSNAP
jgi:hypothetical protein